jgi:hypothetical protein
MVEICRYPLETFRKLIFKMVTSVVAISAICSRYGFSDGLK